MFPYFNVVSFPKFQTHRVVMGAGLTYCRTWKGIRVTRKEKMVSSSLEGKKRLQAAVFSQPSQNRFQ